MVSYCHGKGVTLGDINLKNIYIDGRLWLQYYLPPSAVAPDINHSSLKGPDDIPRPPPDNDNLPSQEVPQVSEHYLDGYVLPSLTLSEAVIRWCSGDLTNFDYLMLLNYHAGRCLGDPNNHPIFPWVTDFVQRNGTLRDLTCSKHRLTKGDRQLDFTYQSAMEEVRRGGVSSVSGIIPHHIGDIASDVTYYVYLARRTPKNVLCSRVRPRWVPEEYPLTLEKMYNWTPDECIPEFFTDPSIFCSIHPDLPDLGLPSWCSSPEELIATHRNLLESDVVSSNLHHWIDLVFGVKLSGDAAVRAKNVYLSLVDGHTTPRNCGIVQLFRSSHPQRHGNCSAPMVVFQWQQYLHMSSIMSIVNFDLPLMTAEPRPHAKDGHRATRGGQGGHPVLLAGRQTSEQRTASPSALVGQQANGHHRR